LTTIPAVKAALKLLEARAGWEQIEHFGTLIKNDYVEPFSVVPRDALDNALAAVGLQLGTQSWLNRAPRIREFHEHTIAALGARAADPEESAPEVRRRRREIVAIDAALRSVRIMREYLEILPETGTLGDFIAAYKSVLYAFRIRLRLDARLRDAASRRENLAD